MEEIIITGHTENMNELAGFYGVSYDDLMEFLGLGRPSEQADTSGPGSDSGSGSSQNETDPKLFGAVLKGVLTWFDDHSILNLSESDIERIRITGTTTPVSLKDEPDFSWFNGEIITVTGKRYSFDHVGIDPHIFFSSWEFTVTTDDDPLFNQFAGRAHEDRVDTGFISAEEGDQHLDGYVPPGEDGKPDANSGATIGTGVDLASLTVDDLRAHGANEAFINQVRPFLGPNAPRGQDAQDLLNEHPITITRAEANLLDREVYNHIHDIVVRNFNAETNYTDFDQLPAGAQTAIMDVAYQYGPYLGNANATPNFWHQVTTGDWQGGIEQSS
ncbi:MAG: pesticin C-terminus-like muramidase [Pseudomonadales bacterium]|nr:pesticin C-terminus-like muramidase [Pseudomonadales bacterium]